MVRQDIVGGLRVALSKGQPLEKVIQTFYNAGYEKTEVDEAVRSINPQEMQQLSQVWQAKQQRKTQSQSNQQKNQQQTQQKQIQQVIPQGQTQQIVSQYPQQAMPIQSQPQMAFQGQMANVSQSVSNYETPKSVKKNMVLIFVMIGILIALVGLLVTVFIFKDSIISFFNG